MALPLRSDLLTNLDSSDVSIFVFHALSVTTLYVGGIVDESITEKDLRDHFYQFGEVRSINLTHKNHCAFITFTTRSACEQAAEKSFNKVTDWTGLILRESRST